MKHWKYIYIVLALWDPGQHVLQEVGNQYIYVPWSKISWPRDWSLKWNTIIQHPPSWEYDTWQFNSTKWLGMYMVAHYTSKVCGQSESIVLRFPGPGILVPCRHSQIFMAAQVWHGRSQALVPGHSFEQLVWWEQLGPGLSGLLVL